MAHKHWEQNKDATVYIGNIDERASDALVYELMLQAGPVVNVHLPKDRVTQNHQGFGFVEFNSEQDADYAAKIMNGIRLYTKPLRVNMASADKQKAPEIGAELFVGNLDPLVDEKVLYDTFSRFGGLVSAPKIARDENGGSKGYGFVSYTDFDASDEAIVNMNGQYLMSKEISVQYAYKKDGKGERHGDEAERKLAAQAKKHNMVPETHALPPALVMNSVPPAGPAAMANPPATPTSQPGGQPPIPGGPPSQPHVPTPPTIPPVVPVAAQGAPAPPAGFGGGPPPSGPPRFNGPPASSTPPNASRSNPLPPPPSGLPPRPPPSTGGYGGPADFRPPTQNQNYRQGPPPPAPSGFGNLPAPPPSGFPPGAPPPGGPASNAPPGAPPAGFGMPPPGFPPGAPPAGFPRR